MKLNVLLASLVGIAIFTMTSCSKPEEAAKPVDLEAVKVEIQKMEDAFAAAEKAKDADGVVAYYSDDAISYGRDKEPVSGKAAIKEMIAAGLAKDTTGNHNVYKVVDLFAEGNMVVEIGSWTELDSADAMVRNGYYMSYFRKDGDKYQCVRDMNVSAMPKTNQ